MIFIQMNQKEEETEISPTKQNVKAAWYLVSRSGIWLVGLVSGKRELYGDATHKIYHHIIYLRQKKVNYVSGRSHLWGLMFQQHGTESGDNYKQFYIMLLGAMII